MSIFNRVLGRATTTDPEPVEPLGVIGDTATLLETKIAFLESKITAETAKAVECLRNRDDRGAMMSLKRKNSIEGNVERLKNTLLSLQIQRDSIETAIMNQYVYKTLKIAMDEHSKLYSLDDQMDVADFEHRMQMGDEIISGPRAFAADRMNTHRHDVPSLSPRHSTTSSPGRSPRRASHDKVRYFGSVLFAYVQLYRFLIVLVLDLKLVEKCLC